MVQELYISGQLMDMDKSTDVVLEYKSNIFGDISKIEGSHSYTIQLPKTRQNLRVLKDPGNPAGRPDTLRKYLPAKYYRNGIDLFGDCMAVILESNEDSIQIALTMQGLKGLASWSAAAGSIKDLYNNSESTDWNSVSAYESMLRNGLGIARMDAGTDMDYNPNAFYPPAVSLNSLFTKIMAATGVTNYQIPDSVRDDMKELFVPFADVIGTMYHLRNAAHAVGTGRKREPAREAVHLSFSDFDVTPDPQGWSSTAEAFRVPDGSDTFIMGLFTVLPEGTFMTDGPAYFRIMGSNEGRDMELYAETINVNPDGSALLSYSASKSLDVSGFSWIWVEVSNVNEGTHQSTYENSYTFLFQGPRAIKGQSLLIGRNLPDVKQLDLLKFICNFYGLAILPAGTDGLNFVPYSVLIENKATALDWSEKLLGGTADAQRGAVAFDLSGFAQKNIIKWTDDDNLEYTPTQGILEVDDKTIQAERVISTLPFGASYQDKYPMFAEARSTRAAAAEELNVTNLKPRIFRLINQNDSAALYFTGDMNLPARVQEYFKEYQDIIREPVTQKVECILNEKDLKELDFSIPVYFRQFGHFYALESVRTSSKADICETKLIQL